MKFQNDGITIYYWRPKTVKAFKTKTKTKTKKLFQKDWQWMFFLKKNLILILAGLFPLEQLHLKPRQQALVSALSHSCVCCDI